MIKQAIYKYPRAALTVDIVVFGYTGEGLSLLLIERKIEPFKGRWALPGGFVRVEETLEQAARRELQEEAGVRNLYLEQVRAFDELRRDPRERVISIAFLGLVRPENHPAQASAEGDAAQARWFELKALPPLAFDHAKIVEACLRRLRDSLSERPVGVDLLPASFTLTQLQELHEAVLGREVDKRNFRKRVLAQGFVKALGKKAEAVPYRAPALYRFL